MEPEPSNLPAKIADAIVSIPKGLTPGVLKALDRLLGATVDIPVAWLQQKKAKIDAQTESYKLVEASIAQAAASEAGGNSEIVQRAMNFLVRKEYRKQVNRDAVAAAMVEDMRKHAAEHIDDNETVPNSELDEDWLNIFERYAEDASSERLQDLWGRVLAGEIRRPGRFSMRTLRFLSEFSQTDALAFEAFAKCAFCDFAPRNLVIPEERKDIRELVYLESSGLIQGVLHGATGMGLKRTFNFNNDGYSFIQEGNLAILFKGKPNYHVTHEIFPLTPVGQELLSLVTNRDARGTAKAVALASRVPEIHECYIGVRLGKENRIVPEETLWINETPVTQTQLKHCISRTH